MRASGKTALNQIPLIESVQRHFLQIEKNVVALGFFTPSSSRILTDKKKVISLVRYLDGKKIETTATILPSAYYGLPVTADQDKYFALMSIVQQMRRRTGAVVNPIGFTSAELLRALGKKKNGKNYDEVAEWMKRMTATTITAAVYLAGRRAWLEDTFHVFERAVLKGMEMPDGKSAATNYVWLSSWQLENITANYHVPVDFDAYKQIRNHIAKALVPLMQIWLYSSMGSGRFEKSYADFCQLLSIRRYEHLSKIRSVLAPSFDELASMGYISTWAIEPRTSGEDFKIALTHGPKFFADREHRLLREKGDGGAAGALLQQLVKRGIAEATARELIARIPEGQPVVRQLEWGDYLIRSGQPGKFRNPAGFYVYLLRNAVLPPPEFAGSQPVVAAPAASSAEVSASVRRLEDENEYYEYRRREIDAALARQYPAEQLACELNRLKQEIRREAPGHENWLPVRLEEMAMQKLRAEIAARITLLTFEEYLARRERQMTLFLPAEN